jgi:hypothetical protein
VAAAVGRELVRAGFFAPVDLLVAFLVGFLALVVRFAAVRVFLLVALAFGRFLVVLRLLVARAFVREDRFFAMPSR